MVVLACITTPGVCGERGLPTATPDACRRLASENAVNAPCAEFYARQAMSAHHVDPSRYARFDARFLPDRRVWVVTARFEPATPDKDKDIVVGLNGEVQFVP